MAQVPVRDGEFDFPSMNHRAQLSLMMVLTYSAYKMAVGSRVPAISYLTLLDAYMMTSGAFVMAVAVCLRITNWIAIASTPETVENADLISGIIFGVWFVVGHAYLCAPPAPRRESAP